MDTSEATNVLHTLEAIHASALEERLSSVEELVCAVMTDNDVAPDEAQAATLRLREAFVNWNEARVARLADLARTIGAVSHADDLAKAIRELLGRIFDRTGGVNLSHLAEMKVSEARRALMEIEPVGRAVADRILMMEVPGASMPFSSEAIALARKLKIISKSGTKQHVQKWVQEGLDRTSAAVFFFLFETHASVGCTKSKCPLCKKT